MEIYRRAFGSKLSDLLRSKNIKQNQLADKIGIEAPNVSRWVNGVTFPDEAHFARLCEALEISPEYFTVGPEGRKSAATDLIGAIVMRLSFLDENQLRTVLGLVERLGSSRKTSATGTTD